MTGYDLTTIERLAEKIAQEHGLRQSSDLFAPKRHPTVVRARDHLFAVVKWSTGFSWPEMAEIFGMDHTSILVAVRRHEMRLNGEAPTKREKP
jgi:chromosomal replication initiation ATPase DnaA